jgi:hypothetical protein
MRSVALLFRHILYSAVYNQINGAVEIHFEKQMNEETKLIIHNITATTALKFGSEA